MYPSIKHLNHIDAIKVLQIRVTDVINDSFKSFLFRRIRPEVLTFVDKF